jgi:predicted RNase H-like nuclease (RuvC/YqgF family)
MNDDTIEVIFDNNQQLINKINNFEEFQQKCLDVFDINENKDNYIFYVKIQDLKIEISDQQVYYDNLILELNTPTVLIEEKDNSYNEMNEINELKKKIIKTIEEMNNIDEEISKKERCIENYKTKIKENQKLLEKYKESSIKQIQDIKDMINRLKNPSMISKIKNSNLMQSEISITQLQSINFQIHFKNIPSISKSKIETYYSIDYIIVNKGPISFPQGTKFMIIESNSAFKIYSNKYINKDREIPVNEKVNGTLNISVVDRNLLKNGMIEIKFKLKDDIHGNFGKEFRIKVAVED